MHAFLALQVKLVLDTVLSFSATLVLTAYKDRHRVPAALRDRTASQTLSLDVVPSLSVPLECIHHTTMLCHRQHAGEIFTYHETLFFSHVALHSPT